MSAVFLLEVSWGRGKRNKRKEWYPTHPRPTVATLPHTFYPLHYTSRKSTERCVAQIVACVIFATEHLCIFITDMRNRAPRLCERTVHLPVESVCPALAWHRISPCLLIGLGIYCNAIVLDGIGPVLTLMMPSSLNLESLLLCWRPYMGMGMYEEGGLGSKWKDVHHPPDPVKTICMLVIQPLFWG